MNARDPEVNQLLSQRQYQGSLMNQPARAGHGSLKNQAPRRSALTNTRQNQFYEKGNFDQRLATRRMPDCDR